MKTTLLPLMVAVLAVPWAATTVNASPSDFTGGVVVAIAPPPPGTALGGGNVTSSSSLPITGPNQSDGFDVVRPKVVVVRGTGASESSTAPATLPQVTAAPAPRPQVAATPAPRPQVAATVVVGGGNVTSSSSRPQAGPTDRDGFDLVRRSGSTTYRSPEGEARAANSRRAE